MKKLFLIICCLFFSYSQGQKIYKYYVYLNDSSLKPEFTNIGNYSVYTGKDDGLKTFFSKYKIISFEKGFPSLKWESMERVLILLTESITLANDLKTIYPSVYRKTEDFTNDQPQLLVPYYPVDYGNTNPNGNTGANIRRNDLDYINMPKAWEITTGISSGVRTKIGISDAKINTNDQDFVGKVSFVGNGSFQSLPYNPNDGYTAHGTAVGGIAAARGDNPHGSVGVCFDCDIVHTAAFDYENLYRLAESGARVINMSWSTSVSTSPNGGYEAQQTVIDSINSHYKTVLVAGAGNLDSYQTTTDYDCSYAQIGWTRGSINYSFPASYRGVISVSSVNHEHTYVLPLIPNVSISPSYYLAGSPSPLGQQIFVGIQGSFSNVNGTNQYNPIGMFYSGWQDYCVWNNLKESPNGILLNHTTNPEVDILAPTHDTFRFDIYAEQNQTIIYSGGGTSGASPRVAGTAALMKTVNDCLTSDEVDDILKLTSKDVEVLPFNQIYDGQIGAGALDSGDAVIFVNEMKKTNGLAQLKNHLFKRFDFKLDKINCKLSLENIIFRDNCKADFTARNEIRVLPGSKFIPNSNGTVSLKINSTMDVSCAPRVYSKVTPIKSDNSNQTSTMVLYPNPNDGKFDLFNINFEEFGSDKLNIIVFDINGRKIYENKISSNDNHYFEIQNLKTGIYILKIFSDSKSQEIKFIKN